jgi:hypothetical protein
MQSKSFFIRDKPVIEQTIRGASAMFSEFSLVTGGVIEPDEARPDFQCTDSPLRVVRFVGAIDALAATGGYLALRKAWKDPAVRTVVLSIDSLQSVYDIGELVTITQRLADAKLTVAVIHTALGASYQLAAATRLIYALPWASVGLNRVLGGDATCDAATIATLQDLRPGVDDRTWQRLLTSEIASGEHLEAHGLADFVVPSEAALVSRLIEGVRR